VGQRQCSTSFTCHPGVAITCDLESMTPTSPRQADLHRLNRKGNIRVDIRDGVGQPVPCILRVAVVLHPLLIGAINGSLVTIGCPLEDQGNVGSIYSFAKTVIPGADLIGSGEISLKHVILHFREGSFGMEHVSVGVRIS
jgi:hypothetical protein